MDFLYGDIVPAPADFAPPEVWPEYGFIAAPPPICARETVGESPAGIRWSFWPLTFEQYCSDLEPDLKRSTLGHLARNRQVIWHRIRRRDVPKGWHQSSTRPPQIDGFRTLEGDITANWHKNARRDLKLWRDHYEDKTHRIERISLDEFHHAYRKSLIGKRLGMDRFFELRARTRVPKAVEHIELWGVRTIASGEIIGGTGIIHSPTYKSSTHMAPFILLEGRGVYAATALNYHWFSLSKERGHTYAVSTNFWFAGKPKSWKGFSEFKSHFGWQYIAYPPELTRFVRGKLL